VKDARRGVAGSDGSRSGSNWDNPEFDVGADPTSTDLGVLDTLCRV